MRSYQPPFSCLLRAFIPDRNADLQKALFYRAFLVVGEGAPLRVCSENPRNPINNSSSTGRSDFVVTLAYHLAFGGEGGILRPWLRKPARSGLAIRHRLDEPRRCGATVDQSGPPG